MTTDQLYAQATETCNHLLDQLRAEQAAHERTKRQLEALAEYTRETWPVLEAAKRLAFHMEAFNLDALPNLWANVNVIKEWMNK